MEGGGGGDRKCKKGRFTLYREKLNKNSQESP